MQNGALWCQTSFKNLKGTDRPSFRATFGYGTPGYNANHGHMSSSKASQKIYAGKSASEIFSP